MHRPLIKFASDFGPLLIFFIVYFKTENNCNDHDWYWTEEERVDHKLEIIAYVEEINEQMYITSSRYVFHPSHPHNAILAYYKLKTDEDGQDNEGLGIEYYGYDAELDIVDLNLTDGTVSGTFSATLFRGTHVNDPFAFIGVDPSPNVDLFNPSNGDNFQDLDEDGYPDVHLADSIRIENGVFQSITVINNIPY